MLDAGDTQIDPTFRKKISLRPCVRDDFEKVKAGHIYDSYKGNDYIQSLICPDNFNDVYLYQSSDKFAKEKK